ncbi:hypothetical protein NliqN6_2810 [Naganishia liquefaciens]|uniref:Uncharacterized protein n=1 Tax=Naganishia liquefaciens TaxID=104408 RepID=A0A8H3YEM2_9TREE|nr:hypothetical protein NliqN6_2810 [Naganishia liquefaciens]
MNRVASFGKYHPSPPLSEIFTPLREIATDSSPESNPPSADALTHLVQLELFCADANGSAHATRPIDANGWREYVRDNGKPYGSTIRLLRESARMSR